MVNNISDLCLKFSFCTEINNFKMSLDTTFFMKPHS